MADEPEVEPVTDSDEEDRVQEEDDPEIKLDLARAYLSLGDKEASKAMLDEVLKSGNEAQQEEARQMLEEL
ncbi:MAG: tetratricopeptide repeat protein [Xanthomonadales bacterium]|nr:tetratricopeptide repeat protein [Xanthomonadales bacterium]